MQEENASGYNVREKDEAWSLPHSLSEGDFKVDLGASFEVNINDANGSPCYRGHVAPSSSRHYGDYEKRNQAMNSGSGDDDDMDESFEQGDQGKKVNFNGNYRYNRTIGYLTRNSNDSQFNSKNKNMDNPIPRSDKSRLMQKLLHDVTSSVTTFKPSASISALVSLAVMHQPEIEIDVVITGGGMKGYFMAGASYVLLSELEKQNVKIARVAGASAGAWGGFFILTGLSVADWVETYFVCARNLDKTLLEAYIDIWPFFQTLIPDDAYKQCSGRLFISITEITLFGLQNRIVSEFSSNEDLFKACLASSSIPYLTWRKNFFEYRNMWCLDGGFTNNTPIFEDGVRRQLVFKLYDVEYPWRLLTTASDSCIEALVLRGAICMSRFLQGEPTESISWLERREKKTSLAGFIRPGHYMRMVVTPIIVCGMMLFHGLGLAQFQQRHRKRLERSRSRDSIVPFDCARQEKDSPLSYLRRVLWGGIVDVLQRNGVLL